MSTYEIKTHRIGRTYTAPHFFILNRAERKEIVLWTILVKEPAGVLENSGKPLDQPCPNCFVLTAPSIEERGCKITKFHADWKRFGRAAGPKCNEQMANYANSLIAFWDGKSRGTKKMIDLAKGINLKIRICCC